MRIFFFHFWNWIRANNRFTFLAKVILFEEFVHLQIFTTNSFTRWTWPANVFVFCFDSMWMCNLHATQSNLSATINSIIHVLYLKCWMFHNRIVEWLLFLVLPSVSGVEGVNIVNSEHYLSVSKRNSWAIRLYYCLILLHTFAVCKLQLAPCNLYAAAIISQMPDF